jgi:hypothetical protein
MEADPTSEELRAGLAAAVARLDHVRESLEPGDELVQADREVILERRVEALEGIVAALVQCSIRLMKRTN